MRKLLIVALTLLLLTSCNDKPFKEKDETADTTKISEAITEEIKVEEKKEQPFDGEFECNITAKSWDEAYELSNKEKAMEFLSAICLKDRKVLEIYMSGDTVDELLKINADFTLVSEKEAVIYYNDQKKTKVTIDKDDAEGHEKYKDQHAFDCYIAEVIMTVSNSHSDIFPVGIYEYTLKTTHSGFLFVNYFGPTERFEIFEGSEIPDEGDSALYSNYKFIEEFFRFSNKRLEESLDPNENFDGILHVAVHSLMSMNDDFVFTTTLEEFKEYISLRFGYTDEGTLDRFANALSKKSYMALNDDGSYTGCCAHGYSTLMNDLTSVTRMENLHNFTYTTYADSAHMVPVNEIRFTFEENKDSDVMTLRHIKSAKLNDLKQSILSP